MHPSRMRRPQPAGVDHSDRPQQGHRNGVPLHAQHVRENASGLEQEVAHATPMYTKLIEHWHELVTPRTTADTGYATLPEFA